MSCPKCGAPVSGGCGVPVRTVEKTAKVFKGQLIAFVIGIVFAFLWALSTGFKDEWALVFLALSTFGYIGVRIQAWWHHG